MQAQGASSSVFGGIQMHDLYVCTWGICQFPKLLEEGHWGDVLRCIMQSTN